METDSLPKLPLEPEPGVIMIRRFATRCFWVPGARGPGCGAMMLL